MARWFITDTGGLATVVSLLAEEQVFAIGFDPVGGAWVGLRRLDGPGLAPGNAWGSPEPVRVPGTTVQVIITASDLYEPLAPWPLDAADCWHEVHGGERLTMHGRVVLAELIRARRPAPQREAGKDYGKGE